MDPHLSEVQQSAGLQAFASGERSLLQCGMRGKSCVEAEGFS